MPNSSAVVAAAGAGQPAELHREHHDQHQPDPERRQREAEDAARHDRAADRAVGIQPGIQPQRDAEQNRHQHRGHRQLHRRRHALRDQPQRRLVEHEAAAEIAVQRVVDEQQVLLPQRLIEPERRDDARAFGLVRLGRDQDIDRIADHVHADEHDHRHRKHDEQRLDQPPDQPGCHSVSRAPELAYIMPGRGDAIGWPPPAIRINCRRMDASATAPRLSTVDLLARLVSFDTTSRNSNLALIGVRPRLPGRAWNSVSYQHRCLR